MNGSLFPMISVERVSRDAVNALLTRWGHRVGPILRPPEYGMWADALLHEGQPVACAVAATLIREHVGDKLHCLNRQNTVELARICAVRPDLSRAMLRLWRELIFPSLGFQYAISYQDAALHTGDLYRFDGWVKIAQVRASGTDGRTGRQGRPRVIWGWPRSITDELAP